MVRDTNDKTAAACARAARALQIGLLAFCALAVATLLAIYVVAPAIYVQTLLGSARPADPHPAVATLFMVAIVALVAVLALGVVRRWRWLFWLVLAAFTLSGLQILAGALELAGIIPVSMPAWYVVLRMLVAVIQLMLGVWMIRLYLRCGVWAMGRLAPLPQRGGRQSRFHIARARGRLLSAPRHEWRG